MKKLWAMIKNNPEVAGYVGLLLLVFGACFFVEFSFVAAVYILLFAFFLRNETKILGLILFVYCFYLIFNVNIQFIVDRYNHIWTCLSLINILLDVLNLFVFLLYIKRIIRKEKKINLKLFIPIVLFLIYMGLPFHECEWSDLANVISSYLCLYVVFEIRHEIDFIYLVRIFALALILSCVFGLYNKNSALLEQYMNFVPVYFLDKFRYPGLTFHPLHLAALAMLLICSLLILKYKNKISNFEFFLIFIPIFVFGYITISRSFLITVASSLLIFFLFYIKKNKTKSLKFVLLLLMSIILVSIFFLEETRCLFFRLVNYYDSQIPNDVTQDWWNEFFAGNICVELNRKDIFKYYLIDWSSSLQTILIGRGISKLPIGGLNAHNIFLQRLWEHGLVGYAFYLIILLSTFKIKKFRNNKLYEINILLIPFLLFSMVEVLYFEYIGLLLVIVLIGWLYQVNEAENRSNNPSISSEKMIQTCIFDDYNLLNNLKLSIIIPVYNGEKFIKRCINKVLQISLNKEIIVINDGSTDGSLELLQSYGEKIILINLAQNKGVSYARNLGLERASGDYVSFIDIDDDFELDMHQKILYEMITQDANVGICRHDYIKSNGSLINREGLFNFDELSQHEVIKKYLLHKLCPCIWTSVYQASLAKSISFENEVSFGEDTLYQLKVLIKAKKTCFVNKVLYHYIKNNLSVTNLNASPERCYQYLYLLDYLTEVEIKFLNNQFCNEFNFFKSHLLRVFLDMVSRWKILNSKKSKDVISFLSKIINKETCIKAINSLKPIRGNKKLVLYMRVEFYILKKFGIKFYLFVFPFLDFLKNTYFRFKFFYKKLLKE